MKKSVRLLSALMTVLMITALFACTKKPSDGKENTGTGASTEGNETQYKADYLPTDTYGGRSFRVGIFDEEGSYDITAENATNTVDKAVYDRNKLIEQRYDVDIKEIKVADTYDDAFYAYQTNYLASEDVYDVCKQIMRNAWLASVEGILFTLLTVCAMCKTEIVLMFTM